MSALETVGIVIGGIAAGLILLLSVVTVGPGFRVPLQPIPRGERQAPHLDREPPANRTDVEFEVEGTVLRGWLYLPAEVSEPVPGIVMTHGLGGTKDMLLEAYALRYTEAGYGVLTFDYRFFGASDGEPRQLLLIPQQLVDLAAAVAYARGREEIDPERIAVWGTSAGGGYGLTIAAKDPRIACVVSHVAGLDPEASGKAMMEQWGMGYILRLLMHGVRDNMRSRLGLPAHMIPLFGEPGSLAMITAAEARECLSKVVPEGYANEACARVFAPHGHGERYRPIEDAKEVRCPVLIQIAEQDSLAPPSGGEKAAAALGELAVVKRYPVGHFEIYFGEHFERAVSDQVAFFRENL